MEQQNHYIIIKSVPEILDVYVVVINCIRLLISRLKPLQPLCMAGHSMVQSSFCVFNADVSCIINARRACARGLQ